MINFGWKTIREMIALCIQCAQFTDGALASVCFRLVQSQTVRLQNTETLQMISIGLRKDHEDFFVYLERSAAHAKSYAPSEVWNLNAIAFLPTKRQLPFTVLISGLGGPAISANRSSPQTLVCLQSKPWIISGNFWESRGISVNP